MLQLTPSTTMSIPVTGLILSNLREPPYPNNPTRGTTNKYSSKQKLSSIINLNLSTTTNPNSNSPSLLFLRHLTVFSVFLLGLGLNDHWAFSSPASALSSLTLHYDSTNETVEEEKFEDEEMKARFDSWKSKTYALTVPLRIVALNGSLPTVWIKEFLKSQGKRVRFRPEFRQSLKSIFSELSDPFKKGKLDPRSAVTADLVTVGDSWLHFAISKGLIEPIEGAEDQEWFQNLSDKWKVYLRRSRDGKLDSQGKIWAVPYRWGSMVIAYNKKEFQKRKLAPVEDWSDLWRPELTGKISMIDSPREIVGAVLKHMGASYNTTDIDSQVVGGTHAVQQQLESFVKQVRLFDTQHYLKAFRAGDVWVTIGWSSDVFPAAKLMSNVAVIVPKSGSSLWADFWVVPSVSRLVKEQIGGRVRGASPVVNQWVDFCLQPERTLPFKEEIIAGASPISLKPQVEKPQVRSKNRPKLDTNLIANMPPVEILSRCEFLEPLSENVESDYQRLLYGLEEPNYDIFHRIRNVVTYIALVFQSKAVTKAD